MVASIITDLKETYGITFNQVTPVMGGLMNLKWKINTEKGEVFVKQYSTKRFGRQSIELIESRLKRQIILEDNGVCCPFLWQSKDRIIQRIDDETVYMVMDFCSGNIENAHTITIPQMHSLGSACALMHKAFSQLPNDSDKILPVFGGYTMDLLWEHFTSCMSECSITDNAEYYRALQAFEPILKQLNTDFFNNFPKGFAHEDFHSGNILFNAGCVSAIVDFDRNCYSYIWHDIGRAILSFALEDNKLNMEKVRAFLEGYSRHLVLTLPNIAQALQLSFCIEAPWWIQPEFFGECHETPRRFKDEMLWLIAHWFELDSLVC